MGADDEGGAGGAAEAEVITIFQNISPSFDCVNEPTWNSTDYMFFYRQVVDEIKALPNSTQNSMVLRYPSICANSGLNILLHSHPKYLQKHNCVNQPRLVHINDFYSISIFEMFSNILYIRW